MTVSIWLSIASILIAAFSLGFSIYTNKLNINDRRLKEHPFFILNQKDYESEYFHEDIIDPFNYNFIHADESSEYLQNLKQKSVKKYRKELKINRNNSFIELKNCGGIGKNISIVTEVCKPEDIVADDTTKSTMLGWDYTIKYHEKHSFGEYGLFSEYKDEGISFQNVFSFDEELRTSNKYKGISAGSDLKVKLPKVFLFYINLYSLRIIKESPKVKITISGTNVYNLKFEDVIEIEVDRLSERFNDEKRLLNISFAS